MAKGFFYQGNGNVVVLRDKRKLLAEIDGAVKKAPVKAKSTNTIYEAIVHTKYDAISIMIFGSSEADVKARGEKRKRRDSESISVNEFERPTDSVEFDIGGNCKVKVFNEKQYLTDFRGKAVKTQETVRRPVAKVRKTFSHCPTAVRRESIEELVKIKNRKGWFTDGYLLVKGELPKGKIVSENRESIDVSDMMKNMEYDRTRPAELQYYCLNASDIGKVVSSEPVLQLGSEMYQPLVVFRVDGRYTTYYQGKFRVLANRFPGAEYRIFPDMGLLVAYEKREPVAGLMPCKDGDGERYDKRYPTQMYVPPMRVDAIEAGFLKERRKALETWGGGDEE